MGEECYALSFMLMNIQFDRNSLFLVYTERICYAYITLDPWSRIKYNTLFNDARENTRTNFYDDLKLELHICYNVF